MKIPSILLRVFFEAEEALVQFFGGVLLLTGVFIAQAAAQTPLIDIPLTVSSLNTGGVTELRFGMDPSATDGRDSLLGEQLAPPLPPGGAFDARFIGSDIGIAMEAQKQDYRQGSAAIPLVRIHEIQTQCTDTDSIRIAWNLPAGVTGRLQDIIQGTLRDIPMTGTGAYLEPNPTVFSRFRLTMSYETPASAVGADPPHGTAILLAQNYPNPFNPATMIRYALPFRAEVSLEVFNALGQKVVVLAEGEVGAGDHEVRFDGQGLASGVYFCRLHARRSGSPAGSPSQPGTGGESQEESTQTRKLILAR